MPLFAKSKKNSNSGISENRGNCRSHENYGPVRESSPCLLSSSDGKSFIRESIIDTIRSVTLLRKFRIIHERHVIRGFFLNIHDLFLCYFWNSHQKLYRDYINENLICMNICVHIKVHKSS